ncbi:hypothetical protein [Phenylobacterium sp.]|uniref:hypothetical protein n=1 Tax=Phenylobacterium sp. TaxID=1871053 RepID=UPI0027314C7E|nr:hypothetical protein [Phenylobacterium sp.]MDP1616121.1 hypothetical protein [Phenylobacterium sp.]MDP1988075.1 hypothetical protein [Phenylobacterium sp.]
MSPSLSVVAASGKVATVERTNSDTAVAERVRRLQAEARSLVGEHVRALEAALNDVERLSAEIAGGGEFYPPGVREIARRLTEDAEVKAQALEAIMARAG